ncbi:MAG: tRNA pseudouridine(38-40) synthase TruA, partial [Planctomycetota bacterium]
MTRTFRITIAYEGTAYAGWQVQPNATTVQGVLERAAEAINGEPTSVLGAGRTDAGVHARGQAARVTIARDIDPERLPHALNANLPEDVVVRHAKPVTADFHPIRDAIAKHYRYTLRVARFSDPFDRRHSLLVPERLNVDAMERAAGLLVGTHDFRGFQKSGSPRNTTVRTLSQLDVARSGDYIHLHFVGNGFLYGMARNLAGTLLRVGQETLDPEAIPAGLTRGGREIAGPSLPPRGLCLMEVHYPDSE